MMLWTLTALASPDLSRDLRPVAAPIDAIQRHQQARPEAGVLACQPLLREVALCFRAWEDKKRRWVTVDDVRAWNTDIAGLRERVAAPALAALKSEPHQAPVQGMDHQYWILQDSDGWAVSPLLHPQRLFERMGVPASTEVRVAMPTSGVFLAWAPGSEELDQVMAVAVRELYDPADDAISDLVYRWDGKEWRSWARARKTGEKTDGG